MTLTSVSKDDLDIICSALDTHHKTLIKDLNSPDTTKEDIEEYEIKRHRLIHLKFKIQNYMTKFNAKELQKRARVKKQIEMSTSPYRPIEE